ncbi:PadR family transcriptional regulator [Clostridium boliviensis]|uniref:PadR family transcriptional regulator n=1 Tax=Clostridium boliviensis TaxID=318465 RepID=A0ABU4GN86_9CLOT|nr:PadR family transcriptional regulator [Clostridium boliviensis]MDW2798472.1 PadR family transcriptional regulator [Clostridium boliviensis]
MVQLFILFFFSIKPTHGYEIQRFISLNRMSEWNNIKSGSIYYAIKKLEKDGYIHMIDKPEEGEKKKQIYEITERGRDILKSMAYNEMGKPLQGATSEKFLLYPIIAGLQKEEIIQCVEKHISDLEKQKFRINDWRKEKEQESCSMEVITLDYMLTTVDSQIIWHKMMLENLDNIIQDTNKIVKLIKETDFMKYE